MQGSIKLLVRFSTNYGHIKVLHNISNVNMVMSHMEEEPRTRT